MLARKIRLAEADAIERDLTVSVTHARTAVVETTRCLQCPLGIETPLFDIAAHLRHVEPRLVEVRRGARIGDRLLNAVYKYERGIKIECGHAVIRDAGAQEVQLCRGQLSRRTF